MDKQDSQTGLCVKYDVKKVETGETVNNCFVLRPDKDPAAVAALRTYARVTPNKALANDIMAWIGADTADKSRLAEVLGVEVGERFKVLRNGIEYDCVICQDGAPERTAWEVIYAVNHPESIIRGPRLTEPEIAIMRAVGATWVSKYEGNIDRVDLWDMKPQKRCGIYISYENKPVARIKDNIFPSVKSGDCIELC